MTKAIFNFVSLQKKFVAKICCLKCHSRRVYRQFCSWMTELLKASSAKSELFRAPLLSSCKEESQGRTSKRSLFWHLPRRKVQQFKSGHKKLLWFSTAAALLALKQRSSSGDFFLTELIKVSFLHTRHGPHFLWPSPKIVRLFYNDHQRFLLCQEAAKQAR